MKRRKIVASVTAVAALGTAATAVAHTTISSPVPGPQLTSASGSYVIRSPNETPKQRTWKIVAYVPQAVATAITVKQLPDWKSRLYTTDTGTKDADGNPVLAVNRISWTARTRGDEIPPRFYGEWPVRFRNPAAPGRYCFGFDQYYTNADGSRRRPEIVAWTGPASAEHPASCLTVTGS